MTPASYSSASFSEVFPLPRWPTRATLRILSAWCMPVSSPRRNGDRDPRCLVLGGQSRSQAQDSLGVQLADPGLGDPEDLADLAERQVLVVVERDDELLALR